MSQTASSEALGVWLLDRLPEIHGTDRDAADTAALLVQHGEQAARPGVDGGIFVTPDGAWLREGSDAFFVALGDLDPDYDAPLFAIKNFGFIFVRIVAASFVDITLHPRNVAPPAMRSLQQWLQSFQFGSFKLNYMKDHWISEILTCPTQVICRLFQISALEMTEDANYLEPSAASNIAVQQIGLTSTAH